MRNISPSRRRQPWEEDAAAANAGFRCVWDLAGPRRNRNRHSAGVNGYLT